MTTRDSSLAAANETSSLRVGRPRFRRAPRCRGLDVFEAYHPWARIQSFQAFAAPFPGLAAAPTHARRRAAGVVRSVGHPARGEGNCSRRRPRRSQYEILGLQGSRALPFPGTNQTFSSRCGANCGFPDEPALPTGPPAPLCRRPKRRSSRDRRPARQARRASTRLQARAAGRASTELDTRPSRSGRRRSNKGRTISHPCQEIVGLFGGGRTDAGSTARRPSTAALSMSYAAPPETGNRQFGC